MGKARNVDPGLELCDICLEFSFRVTGKRTKPRTEEALVYQGDSSTPLPDQVLFNNAYTIELGPLVDMMETPSCTLCRLASKSIMQSWPAASNPVSNEVVVSLGYESLYEGRGGSPTLEFTIRPEPDAYVPEHFDGAEMPLFIRNYNYLPIIPILRQDNYENVFKQVIEYAGEEADPNDSSKTLDQKLILEELLQSSMFKSHFADLPEDEKIRRAQSAVEKAVNRLPKKQTSFTLKRSGLGRRIDCTKSNINLIQEWYSSCQADHQDYCEVSRISGNLSSSTEGLESEGTSEGMLLVDVVQMCLVRVPPRTRYFIVSYVWGTSPFLRLTLDSFHKLMEPEALGSTQFPLPQTLADAIYVTHELGEKYLWIDALCIVQDDETSKMREIARMDMIYASAALTIVCACGNDVQANLTGLEPSMRKPTQLIEQICGMTFVVLAPRLSDEFQKSVWYSRGWTYQEFLLSKRMLIFTDSQAYLYCNLRCTSEDEYLGELPEETRPSPEDAARLVKERTLSSQHPLNQLPHRLDLTIERMFQTAGTKATYKSLIRKYSERQLSYDGDVIRACSSILSSSGRVNEETYLSGIPASMLEWALCWQPNPSNAELKLRRRGLNSTTEGFFPTWSWAGWVGPVAFPDSDDRSEQLEINDWQFFSWEQDDDGGGDDGEEDGEGEGGDGGDDEDEELAIEIIEESDDDEEEEQGEGPFGEEREDEEQNEGQEGQEEDQEKEREETSSSSTYPTSSSLSSSRSSSTSDRQLLPYLPKPPLPVPQQLGHHPPVSWRYPDRMSLLLSTVPNMRSRVWKHQGRMDALGPQIETGLLCFTSRWTVLQIDLSSPIKMPGNSFEDPRPQHEVSYSGLNWASTAAYRVCIHPISADGDSSSELLHVGTIMLERAAAADIASTVSDPSSVAAECVMLSSTGVHKAPRGTYEDWNCNYDMKNLTAAPFELMPTVPFLVNFMWIKWRSDMDIAERVAIGQVHRQALDMVKVEMKQVLLG